MFLYRNPFLNLFLYEYIILLLLQISSYLVQFLQGTVFLMFVLI